MYKCQHKQLKADRAVKIIDIQKIKDEEDFLSEISVLQKVDHPHILKMHAYFKDAKKVYLVTEMCTGGELYDRVTQ